MFRCITELKGIVIDIDSFTDVKIRDWKTLSEYYKCLFFVSDEEIYQEIVENYGEQVTYKIEKFRKIFAPSKITHAKVLEILNLQPTEVAYISKNNLFLDNAMGFLGGTIWITDKVSYEEVSKAPDLICGSLDLLKSLLLDNIKGFLGEEVLFPNDDISGMVVPLNFDVDGNDIPMYILGRYFGYYHYMNQLHPYSTAIALNKKEGKTYYRKFDDKFSTLYSCVIEIIQKTIQIDGVVAVPTRPNKIKRFDKILDMVSNKCSIDNYADYFICIKDYPEQKRLSSQERRDNISGVFKCDKHLSGKNIVIIDDIVTTGATISECVRTLKYGGVEQIFIVVLGINQLEGNYWSSEVAQVICPNCGEKMHLLVNSYNLKFFYSCYSCSNSLDFQTGRNLLCNKVNSELHNEIT